MICSEISETSICTLLTTREWIKKRQSEVGAMGLMFVLWQYARGHADFEQRIRNYERVYETVTDKKYSFIKIFNIGEEVQTNRIQG